MNYASPATVSRAGMVFVDPKNLRYSPYWQRWVFSRPEAQRELLQVYFYYATWKVNQDIFNEVNYFLKLGNV